MFSLRSAGLTDGTVIYVDNPDGTITSIRNWLDESSAQHWIDALRTSNPSAVISATITDYVPPSA
jgi:hypothetical protein